MKRQYLYILITAVLFIGLLFSCSTEKNTALRRGYHSLTAYYNALYNAKEASQKAEKHLIDDPGDNYSSMINIFYYSNDGAATKINNDMGRVLEKTSKAIKKHSITAKPSKRKKRKSEFNKLPEYNKYVDDAYLLKGIAELYKHEYYPAIETFTFLIKEYSMMDVKYDGQMWLARTHLEMNKLEKASTLLDQMEGDNTFPDRIKKDLYLTQAEFYKKKFNYKKAIEYIEKAIPLTKKKTYKYRYHFILAQLYQDLKENDKANENYAIVMRKNPIYKMVFNARINMAQLYNSSQGSSKELKEELIKMMKDGKNIDYLDQIYFALGAIAKSENNIPKALENFKKSAAISKQNNFQKTESYLAVADIYFDKPNYESAQVYYDSAVMIIDKKHRNYSEIYNKSKNLTELVSHIKTINHQDSLQKVASLNETQRNNLINGIIKDLIEKEKEQKEKEQMERIAALNSTENNRNFNTGGGWYFYNPTAVSLGENSFKQKWGRRKLEDHWRRSNKTDIITDNTTEEAKNQDSTRITDNKKREFYLQDLPLTDSAVNVSDSMIMYAYYKLGETYRYKLIDLPRSISTYEKLIKKYPKFNKKIDVYYNLYKINEKVGNTSQATHYRNIIINQYPKSIYAQLMTNPEYVKRLQEKEQQAKFFYQTTWKLFQKREYQQVINNFQRADTAFKNNELYSKFALLNAISKGKQTDSTGFINYLDQYIKDFPEAEEKAFAKDLLKYLTSDNEEPQGVKKKEEQNSIQEGGAKEIAVEFEIQEDFPHYYMAIIDTKKASANKVKFNLGNFNIDYYSMLTFSVKSIVYTANYQAVIVEPFTAWFNAMNYYESIEYINEVYEGITNENYVHFVISEDNYKKLFKTKATAQYIKFFKENYVKKRAQE